ncbi:hypothetical protein MOY_04814 [Halomonas sp. GFAJ-1]|nr:hypothetical protein BB497_15460 [Halomonas sp. GFAJ-1]EHK61707.1 hypothetical protein MOY_04814 [Halomonas sp. GFAJ-1]
MRHDAFSLLSKAASGHRITYAYDVTLKYDRRKSPTIQAAASINLAALADKAVLDNRNLQVINLISGTCGLPVMHLNAPFR